MTDLVDRLTVFWWVSYINVEIVFLYTCLRVFCWWGWGAFLSHRWRLLPDHSCCQGNHAENTFQTCDSARDYQGQEDTVWSPWLSVWSSELWELSKRSPAYCLLDTIKQRYLDIISPTDPDKSKARRPKHYKNQVIAIILHY